MMSAIPLQVLIVEDNIDDAELIIHLLRQSGYEPDWQRVDSEPDYLACLSPSFDLILTDHAMPRFNSVRALQLLQEREWDIPFIIVSGVIDEDAAVSALKRGASDYLLKDRLARLGEAVRYALQQKQLRDEKRRADITLREREEELVRYQDHLENLVEQRTAELDHSKRRVEAILNNSIDGILLAYPITGIERTNATFNTLFACEPGDFVGKPLIVLVQAEDRERLSALLQDVLADQVGERGEFRAARKDGTFFEAQIGIGYIRSDDIQGAGLVCSIHDITELKGRERLLRYHASLQENVTDAVISTDLDFRIQSWNPAAERIYGWRAEEVLGKFSQDVLHTQQLSGLPRERVISDFMAVGHATGEVIQRHRDGRALHILGSTVIFRDDYGQPAGIVAVNHDITERTKVEDDLRESEEKFRLLMEGAPQAIVISDEAGIITLVNAQAEKAFGYNREQLIGQTIELLMPKDLQTQHEQYRKDYGEAPHSRSIGAVPAVRVRRKDGTHFSAEIGLSYIESKTGLLVMSFIADITEREQSAAALEEQRTFLREVIDVSPSLIFVKDYNARFVLVNPQVAQMYNTTVDALIGKSDADFNPSEEEVEHFLQADRQVIASGVPQIFEEPVTSFSGETHWLQTTKVPIVSADGKSKYVLGVATDITERKQAEEALRQAFEKEKELNELKSRFTSMVSHEFRTPLAILMSSTDLLMQHGEHMNEAKKQERFAKIREQVRRMVDLLDETLVISKAESVGLEFNPQRLDMRDFCANLIREFELTTSTHRIEFMSTGDNFEGFFDPKLMHQVITNLLSNAVKYSPQSDHFQIELTGEEDEVVISVRDYGIGIPEEDLNHLFEPFHRGRNVGSISGTGLGLPIVRRAVEAQGGTIYAESKLDVGTTFTIRLPLSQSAPVEED
jgi:PAS domain S-box-containing protein